MYCGEYFCVLFVAKEKNIINEIEKLREIFGADDWWLTQIYLKKSDAHLIILK